MQRRLNPEDIKETYGIESGTVIEFLAGIPFGKDNIYYHRLKEKLRQAVGNDDDFYKACSCLEDISNNGDGKWKEYKNENKK